MKMKKVFFSLAVVAAMVASLAINVNKNNNATSSVNLAELMQTASADEYWDFTWCTDPFGDDGWYTTEPKWLNLSSWDVPFSTVNKPVCYAGGVNVCDMTNLQYSGNTIKTGIDGEGQTITTSATRAGKWVGGSDWALERVVGGFDAANFDIAYTIGNKHLLNDRWNPFN